MSKKTFTTSRLSIFCLAVLFGAVGFAQKPETVTPEKAETESKPKAKAIADSEKDSGWPFFRGNPQSTGVAKSN